MSSPATEEAFHLSAQLPMLVRGIFWKSYRRFHKPERYRSVDKFLEKVSDSIKYGAPTNPEDWARSVFAKHVPDGEIEESSRCCRSVRKLFPQG